MAKLRLTKNELKGQKDALKRFQRYLPTLLLKKQQLQLEILRIHNSLEKLGIQIEEFRKNISKWIAVFGENVGFKNLISLEKICTKLENIAGIDIPIFEAVEFKEKEYDFLKFPLWVDYGIEAVKEMITLKARAVILEKQAELIAEELRITTQRVNLFEKVKIPQAKENIKKISIWLGDLQTAAVVTGKIAKEKIRRKESMLV